MGHHLAHKHSCNLAHIWGTWQGAYLASHLSGQDMYLYQIHNWCQNHLYSLSLKRDDLQRGLAAYIYKSLNLTQWTRPDVIGNLIQSKRWGARKLYGCAHKINIEFAEKIWSYVRCVQNTFEQARKLVNLCAMVIIEEVGRHNRSLVNQLRAEFIQYTVTLRLSLIVLYSMTWMVSMCVLVIQ